MGDQMKDFVWSLLKSGQVVPGYGHAGVSALQSGASHPPRDWQGEEPLAQRGRSLRCPPPVLRHEGDELLHCLVRRVQSSGSDREPGLGQSTGTASRDPSQCLLLDSRSWSELNIMLCTLQGILNLVNLSLPTWCLVATLLIFDNKCDQKEK